MLPGPFRSGLRQHRLRTIEGHDMTLTHGRDQLCRQTASATPEIEDPFPGLRREAPQDLPPQANCGSDKRWYRSASQSIRIRSRLSTANLSEQRR